MLKLNLEFTIFANHVHEFICSRAVFHLHWLQLYGAKKGKQEANRQGRAKNWLGRQSISKLRPNKRPIQSMIVKAETSAN